MWADSLSTAEVQATLNAADHLSGVRWAASLLSLTVPLLDRLRIGLTDRDAYRERPLQPSEMSFLFEVRFAYALAEAGLTASYEHSAGVGNSTVDFRVDLDPSWLVELVSLHESEGFKAAAWTSDERQGYVLRTNADDPRQSEEGETLKAQERIGAKVFDRKHGPIKFPVPTGSIHMLMVDARGFGGSGRGGKADWHQIAYGRHGLKDHLVKNWRNPKTGVLAPIMGLFEEGCPLQAASTMQARIHLIGFICERVFTSCEINDRTFLFCNPRLFENEEAALATLSHWPLRRRSG